MNTAEKIQQLLDSPSTSYWLKTALRALLERDPLDAASDAEVLADVMGARMNEILSQAQPGRA